MQTYNIFISLGLRIGGNMSKPFETDYGWAIIKKGKWYHFPTFDEAWEFYYMHKEIAK